MSQTATDIARRQALCELLMTPDPPDLHRGFVMRLEGKPDRHQLLQQLAAAYVRVRLLEMQTRTSTAERAQLSHSRKD